MKLTSIQKKSFYCSAILLVKKTDLKIERNTSLKILEIITLKMPIENIYLMRDIVITLLKEQKKDRHRY